MSARIHTKTLLPLLLAFGLLAGCGGGGSDAPSGEGSHEDESKAATNRVAIPDAVRSNLGITFVAVERRRVEATLRAPGKFEFLPSAKREYHTMLSGNVELTVRQYQSVEPGEILYHIESPDWHEIQQQLVDSEAAIGRLSVKLESFADLEAAHTRHEQSLDESVAVWTERIDQLRSVRRAGGGRVDALAEARSSLATASASLAEVHETKAELKASKAEIKAELSATRARREFLIHRASSLTRVSEPDLLAEDETTGRPAWAGIDKIAVRAVESGVVESLGLTNGAWADARSTVVTVVKPELLRFHAWGLQSDLGVLRDGLSCRIVPPTPTMGGRSIKLQDTMEGKLDLGLSGDPADRTVDLFVIPAKLASWARPGVTAQLEIVTSTEVSEELAIPLAAVQRDGIRPVIFRRAPDNKAEAIRLEADLGTDDGRWVQVLSGLRDGDEIVLDGAFQLMLATSGAIQKGGHFHADGTFHEGDDH